MRQTGPENAGDRPRGPGRLTTRPGGGGGEGAPGLHRLGLGRQRDGLVYVPEGYRPERPAPLAVMLHGAGGNAERTLRAQRELADAGGYIVLVPESRYQTWDVLLGEYGPDVDFLDRALAQTFARYAVDPAHVAVGGFSDGASYGLSLGLMNGDLFTHVLAFSPGFAAPLGQVGRPRIFISHGLQDRVLPIDQCSRRLVPALRRAGYDVHYVEFDGPHTVPREIAQEGVVWFLGGHAADAGHGFAD